MLTYSGTPTNTTYEFAPVIISPTASTGVSTATNFVVEIPTLDDQANYPGTYRIGVDVNALLQSGAGNLLQPYASSSNYTGGFGLLYVKATNTQAEVIVPVKVSLVPGYTPDVINESPATPMRLLLDPQPGGSASASLLAGRDCRLVFERMLPGLAIAY